MPKPLKQFEEKETWTPRNIVRMLRRRAGWIIGRLTPAKIARLAGNGLAFATARTSLPAYPTVVKIDISPLCNLGCTVCVHARTNGNERAVAAQERRTHLMPLDRYRRIVGEIAGRSTGVSLYWLGDPILHPDLDAMCRIARDAGLMVHVSTHLSLKLSDERLARLARSGLTHLSVCVDGLRQETYEKTRVGGRIDLVLDNLERLCRFKRENGIADLHVEIQYIKYQHNLSELDEAIERFKALGVDQVSTFWGSLHNWADFEKVQVFGAKKRTLIPRCHWPYYSMLIKFNGDVLPCCVYRRSQEYATSLPDSRAIGNVFESSVWKVWNSEAYRRTRAAVVNPAKLNDPTEKGRNFCEGCPALFDTNAHEVARLSSEHTFEEVYALDRRGRPVRRLPVVPGRAA